MLIADDNSNWCAIIARILETDYEIAGLVAQGNEVVSRAVALQPDIITLDISMPGLSGLQVLPRLRSAMPTAVIIVVTVTSDQLYMDEASARGANAYVLKRNALTELIPAMRKGCA